MKQDKFDYLFYIIIVTLLLIFAVSVRAQTIEPSEIQSSGGTFALAKTVVAGGGQAVQNASINAHGTSGQTVAGVSSIGGNFTLYSGFWTPETLAPTAANVAAGGRVTTATGKGIRNVQVTITFPNGETRATVSGASGYYRFTDVPAGETYVFSVSAKRYTFVNNVQIRNISENTEDIDFVGAPSLLTVN